MERQEEPGQVEVEPGRQDLAHEEAVVEEVQVQVQEKDEEEEEEEEQVQVDLEPGMLLEDEQVG